MTIAKRFLLKSGLENLLLKSKISWKMKRENFKEKDFLVTGGNGLVLKIPQQAILPLIVTIFISSFIGWSLGISKNSCNPYFEQNLDQSN